MLGLLRRTCTATFIRFEWFSLLTLIPDEMDGTLPAVRSTRWEDHLPEYKMWREAREL